MARCSTRRQVGETDGPFQNGLVMPALCRASTSLPDLTTKTWMAGTSPAMTIKRSVFWIHRTVGFDLVEQPLPPYPAPHRTIARNDSSSHRLPAIDRRFSHER